MRAMFRRLLDWLFGRQAPTVVSPIPKSPPKPRKKRERTKFCHISNKVCRTEKEAKEKAKQKISPLIHLRAYKCFHCFHWHLTHKKNKLTFH